MRLSATKMGVTNQNRSLGNQLWDLAGGRPSLDLPFADNKSLVDATTGANLVDFTRASSGTYVGSDGLIKTSPVNLVIYSEQFDQSAWIKSLGASIIPNAISSPDGSQTADKQVGGNETNWFTCTQFPAVSVSSVYTGSIYAKAGGFRYLRVLDSMGTNKYFDLETGSTPGMENAGNGWYRCSWTVTTNATPYNYRLYVTDNNAGIQPTGDGVKGVYLWGAQLEEGSTATTYVPTTTSASGAPRFDHDPVTGESLGLLIEESSTNKALRSQNLATSPIYWRGQDGATSTLSSVTAPDGVTDMWLIDLSAQAGTSSSGSRFYQSELQFGGLAHTFSFYARSVSGTGTFPVAYYDGANYIKTYVTLTETTKRYAISCPPGISTNDANIFGFSRRGLTHDETLTQAYVWGCQVELGSFPTSYIPTSDSTVTRAADVASIEGANFSSWFNQDVGTVFTDVAAKGVSGVDAVFAIGTNVDSGRWLQQYFQSSSVYYEYKQGSPPANPYAIGSFIKSAMGRSLGDNAVGLNGSIVQTDTYSGTSNPTLLYIGESAYPSRVFNGHIARLSYWPARLPDSTLQTITQ